MSEISRANIAKWFDVPEDLLEPTLLEQEAKQEYAEFVERLTGWQEHLRQQLEQRIIEQLPSRSRLIVQVPPQY